MKAGDILVNGEGKKLTARKWIPGEGVFVIGKWLLTDGEGNRIKEYLSVLQRQGYQYDK